MAERPVALPPEQRERVMPIASFLNGAKFDRKTTRVMDVAFDNGSHSPWTLRLIVPQPATLFKSASHLSRWFLEPVSVPLYAQRLAKRR
jgi:hypothetical protein